MKSRRSWSSSTRCFPLLAHSMWPDWSPQVWIHNASIQHRTPCEYELLAQHHLPRPGSHVKENCEIYRRLQYKGDTSIIAERIQNIILGSTTGYRLTNPKCHGFRETTLGSPNSRVRICLNCKTAHNRKFWPPFVYWCGPLQKSNPPFPLSECPEKGPLG
jgi:hypothetical protein